MAAMPDIEGKPNTTRTNWVREVYYLEGPPEGDTFKRGDIIHNIAPVPGGYVGWVYVGAPDGWRPFGKIV